MTHFLTRPNSDMFDPVTKRYIWPEGINATGRRMLFTGPDGITDQRVSVDDEHRYVGIGTMSLEGSSELSYLCRPDWKDAPKLHRKQTHVGSIGWGIPFHSDPAPPLSGHQIRRGEFRRRAEDKHTHLYQNPWSPMPSSMRPASAPAGGWRNRSRWGGGTYTYPPELSYPVLEEGSQTESGESESASASSHSTQRNKPKY